MKHSTLLLRFLFCTVFLFGLFTGVYAQPAADAAIQKDTGYEELLEKVKKGDVGIDFRALRFAYAKKPDAGTAAADIKAQAEMIKGFNEKKYKEAIKIAEGIQKTSFVDMNSHVVAAMSYQGLGDAKKAKYHESIYLGLVNSILNGSDGNSPKTAYMVISPAEEYAILNALELARGTREIITEDGHSYSVQTATDKASNQKVKIYFNTDAFRKVALKPVND